MRIQLGDIRGEFDVISSRDLAFDDVEERELGGGEGGACGKRDRIEDVAAAALEHNGVDVELPVHDAAHSKLRGDRRVGCTARAPYEPCHRLCNLERLCISCVP